MNPSDPSPTSGENPAKSHDLSRLKIDRSHRRAPTRWPLLLLILGMASYIGWSEFAGELPGADREVQTARVQRRGGADQGSGVASNGYIVPRRLAALSTDIPGRLVELNVEEGSRVSKGEVVARLDSRELVASLARFRAERDGAEAEQERARLALERQESLIATDNSSRSELDAARATSKAAKARVESIGASIQEVEARIDKSTVYAPFSGVVVEKNAELGEVVSTVGGTNSRGSVATLVDFDTLEVQIELAQTTLEAARIGAPVLIYLDAYPQQGYRGRIRQIWPTADRAKATVELRAEFLERDEKLLPQLGVRVVFVPESEANPAPPQVLLPRRALLASEVPTVLVIRDGIVETRTITLRDDVEDGLVEVGSGLTGGETVVIDPPSDLQTGDRVSPRSPR